MFAHNNSEIDYFRMAVVNAGLIKKHLGVKVCVVTDSHSYDFVCETIPADKISQVIDDLIITDKDRKFKHQNAKVYRDTIHYQKSLSFYNINRADAYEVSPYDETIMLDTDYLVLGNTLNQCWGHKNEFMMNYAWQDINFKRKFELDRLSPSSITMYWATVVYFRKNDYSEHFFTLCKHVRENIKYYKSLYQWSGATYRNDYVFSIAAHLLEGLTERAVKQLPFTLYKSFDYDDIHSVQSDKEITMYLEKHDAPGQYILCKWKDLDLHIMNKWAINRALDDLTWHINNE